MTASHFPLTARMLISKFRKSKPQKPSKEKKDMRSSLTKILKYEPKLSSLNKKGNGQSNFDKTRHKVMAKSSRNREVKKAKSISLKETKFEVRLTRPNTKNSNELLVLDGTSKGSPNKDIKREDYFSTSQKVVKNSKLKKHEIYLVDNEFGSTKFVPNTAKNSMLRIPTDSKYIDHDQTYDVTKEYNSSRKRSLFRGNIWNSAILPHGGALEKPHNEERLNIQNNEQIKIEPKASFDNREKSVDLSIKSGSIIGNSQSLLTQSLINSNKLSKYLTSFIGKKDFRTSEERELDKCTFNPRFYAMHRRYKAIKTKLSPYKNDKMINRSLSKNSDYIEKSKRMSPTSYSVIKNSQSSKKHTYSVYKVDLFCDKNKAISSPNRSRVVNKSTSKSLSSFNFQTKDKSSNLNSLLKFGYTHSFQQKQESQIYQTFGSRASKLKRVKCIMSPTQKSKFKLKNSGSTFTDTKSMI